MKYVMAFDAGTTSCRAILYDQHHLEISVAQREFPQYYPHPGWVEQKGLEIWGTMIGVAQEAIAQTHIHPSDIVSIGITNQRETTIFWNAKTGAPVGPAIVWQCRRSASICENWARQGLAYLVHQKTGLPLDAYFSASKIKWLLEHDETARTLAHHGDLRFGTVDTWLIYQLTQGRVHATDVSNASRTMLYNIHTLSWDKELLDLFDIPLSILPQVLDSDALFGYTDSSLFGGVSIPIHGVLGDQQAALYGNRCHQPGMIKNTYGTGCFLLMQTGPTPMISKNGLITTIAWREDHETSYALEGSVFVGGAAIQWLRDKMRLIHTAPESAKIALETRSDHGLTVIPAFTGLGAPYWDMEARGAILGITRDTTSEDVIRATLESIAYQVADVSKAMADDTGLSLSQLKADGGASANDFLLQFQAELLQIPVIRAHNVEMTAYGAALIAGKEMGFWQDMPHRDEPNATFVPTMSQDKALALHEHWKAQIKRILHHA